MILPTGLVDAFEASVSHKITELTERDAFSVATKVQPFISRLQEVMDSQVAGDVNAILADTTNPLQPSLEDPIAKYVEEQAWERCTGAREALRKPIRDAMGQIQQSLRTLIELMEYRYAPANAYDVGASKQFGICLANQSMIY